MVAGSPVPEIHAGLADTGDNPYSLLLCLSLLAALGLFMKIGH